MTLLVSRAKLCSKFMCSSDILDDNLENIIVFTVTLSIDLRETLLKILV